MNLKLLVLEDSPADLDLALAALKRTPGPPIEAVCEGTLKAAVGRLQREPFDVVLADLNLPDSEGVATIEGLVGPDRPPVVAHTGNVDESQGLRSIEAGADDFVMKGSVDGVRLRQILQFAVQRRRALKGLLARPEERLEHLVLERTRALSDSQALLNLATNSLSEVIFLAQNSPFRILYVNAAYRRLFGLDPEQVMQDPLHWETVVHPADRLRVRALFAGDPQQAPKFLRFRVLHPSGSLRWAQAHVATANDLEGRPRFWSGCLQDITDLVEAEGIRRKDEEREKQLAVAKEADKFKTEFLNVAAHELGNPMTAIRLQLASLRLLAARNPDRLDAAIAALDRNAVRLGGLIQDMLQIARLQSRRIHYNWEEADLADLCREAAAGIQAMAKEGGIEVKRETPVSLRVRLDRERFAQILLNLLSNAVKYTPRPGTVTLRLGTDGPWAVVEVADTGRGIAPQDLPRLFSPFTRVGDTEAVKGTGLGLYICKGFAEAHGGTAGAQSPGLGRGSTFTVRVPIRGPPEEGAPAQTDEAAPAAGPSPG